MTKSHIDQVKWIFPVFRYAICSSELRYERPMYQLHKGLPFPDLLG